MQPNKDTRRDGQSDFTALLDGARPAESAAPAERPAPTRAVKRKAQPSNTHPAPRNAAVRAGHKPAERKDVVPFKASTAAQPEKPAKASADAPESTDAVTTAGTQAELALVTPADAAMMPATIEPIAANDDAAALAAALVELAATDTGNAETPAAQTDTPETSADGNDAAASAPADSAPAIKIDAVAALAIPAVAPADPVVKAAEPAASDTDSGAQDQALPVEAVALERLLKPTADNEPADKAEKTDKAATPKQLHPGAAGKQPPAPEQPDAAAKPDALLADALKPQAQAAGSHRAAQADAAPAPEPVRPVEQASVSARNADPMQLQALPASLALNPTHAKDAVQSASAPTAAGVPLAGIAVEIAAHALEGTHHFDIRLDPPELGRIHVRLDVDRNGEVSSRMIVDRPDTYDLLRRDASGLERALQDAGLKTAGHGLQFSLRDQGGFGDQAQPAPLADTAHIVARDEALPADATPLYRRLAARGGIDIRV